MESANARARTGRAALVVLSLVVVPVLVAACGGKPAAPPPIEGTRRPTSADVAELEIRAEGVDRFTSCPPPGELGQQWIPPLSPWEPPPGAAADGGPPAEESSYVAHAAGRSDTELAAEATHREFRSCFRRGLVRDPTQDGRVAIVLRVGPDGRVAKVEEYGACELAPESIACMKGVAARLRFPPPYGGSTTVTLPAVFTSRDGVRKTAPATPDDAYTAAAYVTIESSRPALHRCEEEARREVRPVQATGTFTLSIGRDGRVEHAHIDPWTGDQPLLLCAARALQALTFAPPAESNPPVETTVIARLNFNPRQGTR